MFPEKGILVPYIKDYLEGEGKELNEAVLKEFGQRAVKVVLKQFMEERHARKGSYGASRATKPACSNYYNFMGIPGKKLDFEALFKMFFGDLVEMGFMAVAKLALEGTPHSIGLNNEFVDVPIGTRGKLPDEAKEGDRKKDTIKCFIDGMIHFNHLYHIDRYHEDLRPSYARDIEDEDFIEEIKSVGSFPFKIFCEGFRQEKPGPNDTWGYLGQVSVEQRALKVKRYVLTYIDREKGNMKEWLGTFDKQYTKKADRIYDVVMEAAATEKPNIEALIPSDCKPVPTSKGLELPLLCNYCPYIEVCTKDRGYVIETEFVKGRTGPKPVHRLRKIGAAPPRAQPLFDVGEAVEQAVSESSYSR